MVETGFVYNEKVREKKTFVGMRNKIKKILLSKHLTLRDYNVDSTGDAVGWCELFMKIIIIIRISTERVLVYSHLMPSEKKSMLRQVGLENIHSHIKSLKNHNNL